MWLEIGLGVGLFTGIVLLLVLVILFARSKLVASGDVHVLVNGRIVRSGGKELALELEQQGYALYNDGEAGHSRRAQAR